MTPYRPGEIVLVRFPFTSGSGTKKRPALVILDTGDNDLVVARITTHSSVGPFDISLDDWRAAGLLAPSNARLHKLATLEKSDIHRRLGQLQPADRQSIGAALRRIADQW